MSHEKNHELGNLSNHSDGTNYEKWRNLSGYEAKSNSALIINEQDYSLIYQGTTNDPFIIYHPYLDSIQQCISCF